MSPRDVDDPEGYSMQELQSSSKRRKTAAACSACKSRKSRCELVTSAGCRRCCVLGTDCSFRTLNGIPGRNAEGLQDRSNRTTSSTRATSPREAKSSGGASNSDRRGSNKHRFPRCPSTNLDAEHERSAIPSMENETLEEVRKRTERLELMMGLMLEQSSKTELAAFATTRQRSHSPRSTIGTDEHSSESQDGGQGFDMDYAMSARFLPLEKLLKPAKIAWADPLAALEMEDHWSEICEIFRNIFSGIVPLPAIKQGTFYLEACPLLRSAILLFVSRTEPGLTIFSRYQQRLISGITERNMASATRVRPTVFRIVALLILANLPPNSPVETLRPSDFQTSPLLAMDMAQHLDLDAGLRILQETNANEWHYLDLTGLLENLCLWYCIAHRLAWANLQSSSTFRTNLPSSYRPMHHLRHLDPIASSIPSISTWWNRLHEESSILERSDIIGERFATIKYARMYEQSQIDMFVADIKTYVVHLRDARVRLEGQLDSPASTFWLDCCAAQINLYFRFTRQFAWDLPFVLGPTPRRTNIISTGSVLVQACLDYTRYAYANHLNHRTVPGFHLPIASLALGTLLQGAAGDPKGGEVSRRHPSDGEMNALCLSISRVHPMIASVIERLRNPLALTEKLSAFFKDDTARQNLHSKYDAVKQDINDTGIQHMQGGMELFTDWLWPADSNWLSGIAGMVMPDWEESSRTPDLSFGVP